MPENEKPKLSAGLLHQLLGEHVEKAGQTLRRKEQLDLKSLFSALALVVLLVLTGGSGVYLSPILDPALVANLLLISLAVLVLLTTTLTILTWSSHTAMMKQDLALAAWQLRRVYELASRYEDTGPQLEPALRTGMVLKLGEAQLLLTQLEKFEAKDGRFEQMRSLGPDPLRLQSREEARPSVAADLVTTER